VSTRSVSPAASSFFTIIPPAWKGQSISLKALQDKSLTPKKFRAHLFGKGHFNFDALSGAQKRVLLA